MSQTKAVLITGCSSGFGLEMAQLLSAEGLRVFAGVRDLTCEGAVKLRALGRENLQLVKLDVTIQNQVDEAVNQVLEQAGRLDVLVNNAGFGFLGPIEDFSIDEVKEQFEVNVYGALRMVKAVAGVMRAQKRGLIINISSVNGRVSFPIYGVYSATKFALETLSEVLSYELGAFGIHVTLVEPGTFMTGFTKHKRFAAQTANSPYMHWMREFWQNIQGAKEKMKTGPFSHLFNPERVARLVLRIINERNPKIRYAIGVDTWIFLLARTWLPTGVWQWCVRRAYGLEKMGER